MILTTKARYAVVAVIEIADNQENQPVSLLSISQKHDISLSYLEQIFVYLKKSGIVNSVKGSKGGYVLGKNRDQITVSEIVKAIGEPIKMTRCSDDKKGCTMIKVKCKTHHLWRGLENKIYEYLNSVSLDDVCK